jgi:hypothetical protein
MSGPGMIELSQFRRGDPLAVFLFDRLRVGPLALAITAAVLETGTGFGQAVLGELLKIQQTARYVLSLDDASQFLAKAIFSLLVTPFIWGFYAWMSCSAPRVFSELEARDLFPRLSDADAKRVMDGCRRVFASQWWSAAALALAITAGAVTLLLRIPEAELPLALVKLPVWFVGWYMMSIIIARALAMILSLRVYFSNRKIRLQPLHPDRCGGLGPLNQYALTFSYLIAGCAFGLGVITYLSAPTWNANPDWILVGALAAYVVLAPYCFFATLGIAHRAMRAAKDELLGAIAKQFESDYRRVHKALGESSETVRAHVRRIAQLRSLYRMTESFPVWPFDWVSIRRFAAAVLTPLIPIAAALLEFVGGLTRAR